MPKAKPTQVIVHRIELQEKERDLLESVVVGNTVKNIGQGVALPAAVVAGSYLSYKGLKAAYGWGEDLIDEIKQGFDLELTDEEKSAKRTGQLLGRFVLQWTTGYGILWGPKSAR